MYDVQKQGILYSLLTLFLVLAAGCAGTSSPSQFYILQSVEEMGISPLPASSASKAIVSIGPVRLPEYVNRPTIVTRSSPNKVDVAEFHRWAGPFQDEMNRIIRDNVTYLLQKTDITIQPWYDANGSDYLVSIDIIRFDGPKGGKITLKAEWIMTNSNNEEVVKRIQFMQQVTAEDDTYAEYVAAQSKLLEKLSKEIALTVTEYRPFNN